MITAVITIVSGRHQHLLNQQRGIARGTALPDHYIVVGMDDPEATELSCAGPLAAGTVRIRPVSVSANGGGLPLAVARNAGARAALAAGADTLIFLDVDCVPSVELVATYQRVVAAELRPTLHCGVVRYLAATDDVADLAHDRHLGTPHPARPVPAPGEALPSEDWPLFWSLSFAVSAQTWRQLGGFCEQYSGYGAEDTDLGYRAFCAGIGLSWTGGAEAHHQYHPTERPPVGHLRDIVDNATVFHRRWGFWPMEGWLTAFRDLGLASYDRTKDSWAVTTS